MKKHIIALVVFSILSGCSYIDDDAVDFESRYELFDSILTQDNTGLNNSCSELVNTKIKVIKKALAFSEASYIYYDFIDFYLNSDQEITVCEIEIRNRIANYCEERVSEFAASVLVDGKIFNKRQELCLEPIKELIKTTSSKYETPSLEDHNSPFIDLIGEGEMIRPQSIERISYYHNSDFNFWRLTIRTKNTGDHHLYFAKESEFKKAKMEISELVRPETKYKESQSKRS